MDLNNDLLAERLDNIGHNIRFLMRILKIDQTEFGLICGSKGGSVSSWCTGRVVIPTEKIITICDYFNISIDSFIRQKFEFNKKHLEVFELYKHYNTFMVDKYGKRTIKKDKCEDIIIANF